MLTLYVLCFAFCSEHEQGWENDIRDDVLEECMKFGNVMHLLVDKDSPQVIHTHTCTHTHTHTTRTHTNTYTHAHRGMSL